MEPLKSLENILSLQKTVALIKRKQLYQGFTHIEECFVGKSMYLSMILGTNFSSESGPEILLNVSLLVRFGGHVTTKKGLMRTLCGG
jgi:hypothetical protein